MKKVIFVIVFCAVVIAGFISLLPEPIDIDLTTIGNGKRSVVFVYDPNRVVSNQQALQMNGAKAIMGDRANFLIARTGYPETSEFISQYNAEIAELLFFDGSGRLTERQFALLDAQRLVTSLSEQ